MTRPLAGGRFALLLPLAALAGCAGPLSQRQAMVYATRSLDRYCQQTAPCGPRRVSGAQRLKSGWLIDFDSTATRYGVMVHDNRATDVSVWKKNLPAASN